MEKPYDASNRLRLPHPESAILRLELHRAFSLVAPERVQFRYQLEEGQDRSWRQVASTDREAQYSILPPGDYVFSETAPNKKGVCNEAGDTARFFDRAGLLRETNWFRAICVAAVLLFGFGVFIDCACISSNGASQRAGLETRVSEQTRIARELHDTRCCKACTA